MGIRTVHHGRKGMNSSKGEAFKAKMNGEK